MDASAQTHTSLVTDSQVQPILRRRYRSVEEKQRIVEKTLVKGASVALVAREHGVNANQVFNWRKLYHKGRLGGRARKLLPATAGDTAHAQASRKRDWSEEVRQRIVEAALVPGASVKEIAQAHGVRPSLVYHWRKKYGRKRRTRKVRAVNLLPVSVKEGVGGGNAATNLPLRAIEIELPKGRMRIMGADAALLRAALELLQ